MIKKKNKENINILNKHYIGNNTKKKTKARIN